MAKQYQQNKQTQLAEEMNQKLYELLEKSGVSFASTNNGDWSDISITLDALGFSNSVVQSAHKLGIYLSKGNFKELLNYVRTNKGIANGLKNVGNGLGYISAGVSLGNYINEPTSANLASFILSAASIGAGPYSSALYGIFSLSKYAEPTYQYLGNQMNRTCNCNAGYSLYKSAEDSFKYMKNKIE